MKQLHKKRIYLFFIFIGVVAFANGLSDNVLANFFKDAYQIDARQRAFIEFPRELPGFLCVFFVAALSFLGDVRIALIAQILSCIGIFALGIFSPSFTVMLLFLFIYSMGMHVFMPLSDSIGMALAEPECVGKRVGQFGSIKTAVSALTGILVFVGFRIGWFTFFADVKWIFLISAMGFLVAIVVSVMLVKETKELYANPPKKKIRFLFRKEYKLYYILATLQGVQKQIAYVFGSWVIIDLLLKGADVMSILIIAASFLGIFFFRYVGVWMDTKGIRFMMYVDALTFIIIYTLYGFVVWGISSHVLPISNWSVMTVYLLFVLDRLSMQVGIVKSVYLKSVAVVPEDVTSALSTGLSLDHMVSIIAAQFSGSIWMLWGPQWVFFGAALLSFGNLYIASLIPKKEKK